MSIKKVNSISELAYVLGTPPEPKDKRTKEYKEYKANFDKQKGLGDVMETVLEKTGVKKIVELFTDGLDCGCDKRKEILNKIKLQYPFQRCFTEYLYNKWTTFKERPNQELVTHEDQLLIIKVTEHLFARTFKPCYHCGNEIKTKIAQIDKVYNEYQ